MLLVEGASDGGGDAFPWATVVPIGISALIAIVGLSTLFVNLRRSIREDVWKYLLLLTSKDVTRARAVIGQASRVEPRVGRIAALRVRSGGRPVLNFSALSRETADQVSQNRDAAFELMWVVALAPMAIPTESVSGRLRSLVSWGAADVERAQVYWHLRMIVDDLSKMLEVWGEAFEWEDSGQRVNEVLSRLTQSLPDPIGVVAEAPARLPKNRGPVTFPGSGPLYLVTSAEAARCGVTPQDAMDVYVGGTPQEDRPTSKEAESKWAEWAAREAQKAAYRDRARRLAEDPEAAAAAVEQAMRTLKELSQDDDSPEGCDRDS